MAEALSRRVVKSTRKPCLCWGCDEMIPVKSRVVKVSAIEKGKFTTWNWCERCVTETRDFDPMDWEILARGELRQRNKERPIEDIGWACPDC